MRIGIDFDNTIVDYEGAFHAAAMERGLITADLPKTKNSVRDFLNRPAARTISPRCRDMSMARA